MRKTLNNRFTRTIAWVLTIATATLSIPIEALAMPQGIEKARAERKAEIAKQHRLAQLAKEEKSHRIPDVTSLTEKQMKMLVGRGQYRNAYFCGTMPWHRSFRDVNLCNGNLFKSFTDVQVAPARGAGLVLQRTYNSNDDREGPFGVGWSQAYDIRMAEASSEEFADEDISVAQQSSSDPELVASTMDKSVRVDFFGGKHVYKRDADGLYTPPPYSHDYTKSNYKDILASGPEVVSDSQMGMDGTEKHFVSSGDERICDYIKDRYGNTTTLDYTTYEVKQGVNKDLITKVTDPSGRKLNFTWEAQTPNDANGNYRYRIVSATAPLQTVEYEYYALSESGCGGGECPLKSVTIDPGGLDRTTTYTYTSCEGETGLLASIADPIGNTVHYQYTLYDPDYPEIMNFTGTLWVYDVTEPAGVDSSENPRSVSWYILANGDASGGGSFVIENDSTDEEGGTINMGAWGDAQLRVTSVCGGYFQRRFWPWGYYIYEYDSSNNVTSKKSYIGSYDPNVLPWGASWYHCFGRVDHNTYSRIGNLKTHWIEGKEANIETYTYYDEDKYFQKETFADMAGNVTTFDYGSRYLEGADTGKRGNMLWCRDARHQPSGTAYTYEYNIYGQKISETNLNGVQTIYTYGNGSIQDPWYNTDNKGNLIKVVQDPGYGHLNRTTWMGYDDAGKVINRRDPKSIDAYTAYNNAGQPTSILYWAPNGQSQSVVYDYGDNGRMESVTDERGTTTIEYEDEHYSQTGIGDRVAGVTDPVTGTISYKYTLRGALASRSLPNGRYWTYRYWDDWWYQYWDTSLGAADSAAYFKVDPDNMDNSVDVPSQIIDDEGRIIISNKPEAGISKYNMKFVIQDEIIVLLSYCEQSITYDDLGSKYWSDEEYGPGKLSAGNIARIENTYHWKNEQGVWQSKVLSANEYDYDDVGNREENKVYGENNVLLRTETYGYDELSRLTSVNYGDGTTQTYTYDDMGNRLTMGGTTYGYNAANMLTTVNGQSYATYDANGNQLTCGNRSYEWDSQNRMFHCSNNGSSSWYIYGADGLRRAMVRPYEVSWTHYAYDGQNVAQEGHFDEEENYITDVSYLTGPRGTECRIDENTGVTKWYLYDGLGSVIGEVDEDGNVTYTAKYDAFGAVRGSTGSSDSKHKFVGGIGHTTEPNTGGLIYMRARWYDPLTGRFVSEDPAKDGANWYTYCSNNPINSVDPDGRIIIPALAAVALIAAGLVAGYTSGYCIGYLLAVKDIQRLDPNWDPDIDWLGPTAGNTALAVAGYAFGAKGATWGKGISAIKVIGKYVLPSYGAGIFIGATMGARDAYADYLMSTDYIYGKGG